MKINTKVSQKAKYRDFIYKPVYPTPGQNPQGFCILFQR